MGRPCFGTDGIRGVYGETLTDQMAFRIGEFLGKYFQKQKTFKVLVGKDTRISGEKLQAELANGLQKMGASVYLLSLCSTPNLVYLTKNEGFDCGIMITASHNPYNDNGIKIISNKGKKLDHSIEEKIEEYIYSETQLDSIKHGEIIDADYLLEKYYQRLYDLYPLDLHNYSILLDCANGSNSTIAEKVLTNLNAKVTSINNKPDGYNINKDCGSTHLESIIKEIKNNNYDIGFAFDGDADRVIAIAKDGSVVDGDKILYCCGKYLKNNNLLKNGKIVTTVMANLGLFKRLDEENIGYEVVAVGDKYVYESIEKNGYILGGEQSGHIIFANKETSGDGLLTALELLTIMIKEKKSLNELTDSVVIYPQLLINVKVKDKDSMMNNPNVIHACQQVEQQLNGNGRVLVRKSGTEPLVRVMVEAKTKQLCEEYCQKVVKIVEEENAK